MFSREAFGRISDLFSFCPELADIATLLFQNNVNEELTLKDYIYFAEDAAEYHRLLSMVIQRLGNRYAAEFIYYWQRNSCALPELRRMERRTRNAAGQDWDNVFSAYSGYVNLLYGTRFKTINFHSTASCQEDILTYAIVHNKKHFIRLVDENSELFCSLPSSSILFRQKLYQGHFNLNELTVKDLTDCQWMVSKKLSDRLFEGNYQYTFPELKLLYGAPQTYAILCGRLRSDSLDYRLGVLRQLRKCNALNGVEHNGGLSMLAERFSQKPLHSWRQEEFGHIEGLAVDGMVQLLLHLEELSHLLPGIRNGTDASLALRCLERLGDFDSMDALRAGLLETDQGWHDLVNAMELTPDFIDRHQETIRDFLSRDGAGIAMTYQESLSKEQRKGFFRVVKAELMGQFNTLKYYEGDLERDLSCPVPAQIKTAWAQNRSAVKDGMTAWERDDFFSTILLGTQPYHTCLSYQRGSYNHCLLACFDSNKKVLYVEKHGRIVGRACIRLTKCRLGKQGGAEDEFSFVDLEDTAGSRKQERADERVTLFLERPYISGAGPEDQLRLQRLMIELAGQKALELGTMLVVSMDYANAKPAGFTQTYLNIYISASKAGGQYLDSLGGSASVSSEKSYRGSRFLVKQSAGILTGASKQKDELV